MSRERFEELLDDWARGRLTPDEAREFDALAGSGEDWREEAEAHRALLRAISAARAVRAPEGLLAGALEKA
ncbi:hypothetical protein HZA57_06720, partial [Candidatus Poribacteria bacterium]|nr:hypothetical protein [Candidatus Poribacteria bacterium]